MKQKKIILIDPSNQKFDYDKLYEPVSLGIIASLTPNDWDVEIFDERIEDFLFPEADFVGITANINNINRAYEISQTYLKKGIKTIIGGPHATLLPEEVGNYCSSLVIGEVETVWAEIIEDFNDNKLKSIYHGNTSFDYSINRNFYKHYYKTATIQISRGCPNKCDFCCVSAIFHGKHYFRDINAVVTEIETVPQKLLFFTDDNMYGYTKHDRDTMVNLFKIMIEKKLNKRWIGFVSMNAGLDEEFMSYARKSGCRVLLVGIESEDEKILLSVNKKTNSKHIKNIGQIFRNFHKNGIAICGAFITAFETDNFESLAKRVTFIKKSSVDLFFTSIYTPFPKTPCYERMQAGNKLIFTNYPDDWKKYDQNTLVYKHDCFVDKSFFMDLQDEIRNPALLRKKFLSTLINTGSLSTALYSNFFNFNHTGYYFKNLTLLKAINQWFEKYLYGIYVKNKGKI